MSYFLRNSTGFFLQLAPSMALCILPFSSASFRFPRKYITGFCVILAITASILFPICISEELMLTYTNPALYSNFYMCFIILVFAVFYFITLRTHLTKKVLVLILVLFYATTQFLLVNMFTPLFSNGLLMDTYPPFILAIYAATTLVLFPVVALMMKKVVKEYLEEIEISNIQREFRVVLTASICYFIFLISYSSGDKTGSGNYWWRVAPSMLFAAVILFLFYWTLFRESLRRKKDSEIQRTFEIQQVQYDKITSEMEQARRLHHDVRHYFHALNDMLDQKKYAEMKMYLQDVIDVTSKREHEIYCSNITVNGLLQYYVGLARNEQIQCKVTAKCDEELNVTPADLTVLFGNAMENAIHACKKYPKDSWIEVQIAMIGGSLVVQISNSCREIYLSGRYRLDGDFLPAEAFVSSRAGGGYGLGSLSHTARKYGGEARFKYDETAKTFTTRIRLNLHPEIL